MSHWRKGEKECLSALRFALKGMEKMCILSVGGVPVFSLQDDRPRIAGN